MVRLCHENCIEKNYGFVKSQFYREMVEGMKAGSVLPRAPETQTPEDSTPAALSPTLASVSQSLANCSYAPRKFQ